MPVTAEEQTLSITEVAAIRRQLRAVTEDDLLRTSRRSTAFLRYIVEETLDGRAGDLKERTIGVNVFGKALTYDTGMDHAVRTAASELRRRLTLYYGTPEHRDELRILLLPGSYVPQFRLPEHAVEPAAVQSAVEQAPVEEAAASFDIAPAAVQAAAESKGWRPSKLLVFTLAILVLCGAGVLALQLMRPQPTAQRRFWQPLLDTSGPVLIGVGDVPNGPPIPDATDNTIRALSPAKSGPPTVPFADAVTIGRVSAILASFNKDFLIRRENSSSFADLRERPVVLVGAFNNEWSLQLTRGLRFSLAMDPGQQLLYIRDRQHPDSRAWSWSVGPHPGESERTSSTQLHDYALITRILDSETGHDVVVLGGLYTYGTQAAGELLASRDMASLPADTPLDTTHKHLQIVLDTVITDGTPGPPHVVAVSVE